MKLIINSDLIIKCGSGSSEFWFSYKDYTVKNIRDLQECEKPVDMGQTTYFVSIGLIPFVSVSNEEIMRGYINKIGNDKIKSVLDKVYGDEFLETFWKYINAYPELKDGLVDFSKEYTHNKIALWCEENNIDYEFEEA